MPPKRPLIRYVSCMLPSSQCHGRKHVGHTLYPDLIMGPHSRVLYTDLILLCFPSPPESIFLCMQTPLVNLPTHQKSSFDVALVARQD